MDFIFELGFSENLALLELSAVTHQQPEKVGEHRYQLSLEGLSQMNYLANRLGGLVAAYDLNNRLVWRHSAKAWIKRDRQKPFLNPHKGLLPPKIARVLVNLAVANHDPRDKTLLDPFCGSGTILMEAGFLGLSLIGGDLDLSQLNGAKQNLNWLGLKAELFHADAVKISHQLKKPVDFIVTEPFMGRPQAREDRLPDLAKGLIKLYLGCLKDWSHILVKGGTIVMVFPVFTVKNRSYSTSRVIDDRALVGYNTKIRGLMYFRPEARVKREIVILEKLT